MQEPDVFLKIVSILDDRENRLDVKISAIQEHLATMADVQTQQKVILEEHVRRSLALEKTSAELTRAVEVNKVLADIAIDRSVDSADKVDITLKKLDSRLQPLEVSASMWSGVSKALVVAGVLVGIISGILKLLGVV